MEVHGRKLVVSSLFLNLFILKMFLSVTGEGSFQVDLRLFSPGEHSLRITATSEEGELATVETILFSVLGNIKFELISFK